MQWHELSARQRLVLVGHQLWTLPRNPRLFFSLLTVIVSAIVAGNALGGLWMNVALMVSIPIVVLLLKRDAERRQLF